MKIEIALLFILMVNVLLLTSQTSVDKIAEIEGVNTVTFFTYQNSLLSQVDSGNYTVTEDTNLPSSGGQVEVDSGNIFTDTFSALLNWISDSTGFSYLTGIIKAMPNFLKIIGLPEEIAFALGAMWHIFTLFLVISWIASR